MLLGLNNWNSSFDNCTQTDVIMDYQLETVVPINSLSDPPILVDFELHQKPPEIQNQNQIKKTKKLK